MGPRGGKPLAGLRYNAGMLDRLACLRCLLIPPLVLLASAAALAQGKQPPAAATPLSACAVANRQALTDLGLAAQASQRRHLLNPLLVARLQSLQFQLAKLRDNLPRTSRTLADCEQAGEAIASEKERLLKLAGPDPEVAGCAANNQQLHSATSQGYEAVQRKGGLAADQVAAFEASGARLNLVSAVLARDGMLAADCRQLAAQLAQERTRVDSWLAALGLPAVVVAPASPVAPVAAAAVVTAPPAAAAAAPAPAPPADAAALLSTQQTCRDGHARSYNELAQSLTAAAQEAPLTVARAALLQSLGERLSRLRGLIGDGAAPGWDCARVGQELAQVGAELLPLRGPSR